MRKKQARIAQRITALVAAAVMSVGLFTGCSGKEATGAGGRKQFTNGNRY